MTPYPANGTYSATQVHPTPKVIPFRVEGRSMFWGDPEVEFKWSGSRWEEVNNSDHYVYFFVNPNNPDERFFIEHDLSQNPNYAGSGTW